MQNSKKISIVIVSYRSKELLESCLVSIFDKMKNSNIEILIVNNDEKENLHDMALRFGGIRVFNNGNNIGFGRAANLGAKNSTGEYLFFLNPDTRLLTDQKKIIGLFEEDKKIGIIGPLLINKRGGIQEWSAGRYPHLFEVILNNVKKKLGTGKNSKKLKKNVDWVSGAAFFVRKELFDRLGGFDENIFMYFEDIDLCRRVRKEGKRTICLAEEKVEHAGGGSIWDIEQQKKNYYVSQDYYFQKHHGKVQAGAVRFLRKIFIGKNA